MTSGEWLEEKRVAYLILVVNVSVRKLSCNEFIDDDAKGVDI